MSDIETGGPAFPTAADNGHSANQDGMTLRDYFAAKAIAGMLMAGEIGGEYVGYTETADWSPLAKHAYGIADAMLQARQQAGRG